MPKIVSEELAASIAAWYLRRPTWQKALFGIGYFILPLDLIPDIPVIGHIDDLGVVLGLVGFQVFSQWLNKRQSEKSETPPELED